MANTISVSWWGNTGKAEIPDEVECRDGEERIAAAIRAVEAANAGTTCVTCRRDGWEQRGGRPVREIYQVTLGRASDGGFIVTGEICISLTVDDSRIGPQSLSYWDRLRSRRNP
ncbi:hypothetical protein [Azospirillum cavernae]|uniref:hypothetical protein n=1 Tax=Azospirillum cavernae TaxID=2320860 RepID=UPI0011C40118|nr:hypothetical protein [Azospirillum cavernae]